MAMMARVEQGGREARERTSIRDIHIVINQENMI